MPAAGAAAPGSKVLTAEPLTLITELSPTGA